MYEKTNLTRFNWRFEKYILEQEIKELEKQLEVKRKELQVEFPNLLSVKIDEEWYPITECEVTLAIDVGTDRDPYRGDSDYKFINSYYIQNKMKKIRIFPSNERTPEFIKASDCPKEIKEQYKITQKELNQIENLLRRLAKNKGELHD